MILHDANNSFVLSLQANMVLLLIGFTLRMLLFSDVAPACSGC